MGVLYAGDETVADDEAQDTAKYSNLYRKMVRQRGDSIDSILLSAVCPVVFPVPGYDSSDKERVGKMEMGYIHSRIYHGYGMVYFCIGLPDCKIVSIRKSVIRRSKRPHKQL